MHKMLPVVSALVVSAAVAFAGQARANPLGEIVQPAASTPQPCFFSDVIVQATNDPMSPYTVPGPGVLTAWQVNPTGSTAGSPITLVVQRPVTFTAHTIVGTDPETLPTPLSTSQIVNFPIAHPITVNVGDTLGLWTGASSGAMCFWKLGSTPTADTLQSLAVTGTPAAGQTLSYVADSGAGFTLNLGATFAPQYDPAVTTGESPAPATSGKFALLASSVINNGPGSGSATFTDVVPSSLRINSAAAGSGACTVSGQTVSCSIGSLASGQRAPVNIVVTPGSPDTIKNSVSIVGAPGNPDPNTANNSASSSFRVVAAAPTAHCVVPKLAGTPKGIATHVLRLLECQVRLRSAHSTRYRRGTVIRSRPGSGKYKARRLISVFVSSGPPPKKKPGHGTAVR